MITRDGTAAAAAAEGFDHWGKVFDALDQAEDLGADKPDGSGDRLNAVATEFGLPRSYVAKITLNRAIRELAR